MLKCGDPGTAFLQWKGTDACYDFWCECGAHCHFDGYFASQPKCPHCGQVWVLPDFLEAHKRTNADYQHNPCVMQADEDHCDEDGNPLPVK